MQGKAPAGAGEAGSPAPAVKALHDIGCLVLADIATVHHAERALAAGVDGLILLTAGAGGLTGWLKPFAFVRAVRQRHLLSSSVPESRCSWVSSAVS